MQFTAKYMNAPNPASASHHVVPRNVVDPVLLFPRGVHHVADQDDESQEAGKARFGLFGGEQRHEQAVHRKRHHAGRDHDLGNALPDARVRLLVVLAHDLIDVYGLRRFAVGAGSCRGGSGGSFLFGRPWPCLSPGTVPCASSSSLPRQTRKGKRSEHVLGFVMFFGCGHNARQHGAQTVLPCSMSHELGSRAKRAYRGVLHGRCVLRAPFPHAAFCANPPMRQRDAAMRPETAETAECPKANPAQNTCKSKRRPRQTIVCGGLRKSQRADLPLEGRPESETYLALTVGALLLEVLGGTGMVSHGSHRSGVLQLSSSYLACALALSCAPSNSDFVKL